MRPIVWATQCTPNNRATNRSCERALGYPVGPVRRYTQDCPPYTMLTGEGYLCMTSYEELPTAFFSASGTLILDCCSTRICVTSMTCYIRTALLYCNNNNHHNNNMHTINMSTSTSTSTKLMNLHSNNVTTSRRCVV